MVLVTGGTGLVGSHLLYFLLKRGETVRAVHRKSSRLESVKKVFSYYTDKADDFYNRIEWMEANVTDIPALTEAFQSVSHVYHAAAYISFDPKHFSKLQKSNIEGTANVVNLCLLNGVKKLCHVSSIATFGSSEGDALISEETQWNPEDDNNVYAITKYGAEMEVWRGTQEGLDAVIVNPGVILGEGYWNSGSGMIIKRAAKGIKYYTRGGVAVVDVQDVVIAMITLMESEVVNQKFILAGENLTNKELLNKLASGFKIDGPKREISKWKLVLFSKLDWLVSKLFGSKRRLLRSMVDSLFKTSFYDGSHIERTIDFSYTPTPVTIERVTANFRKDKI